jgi:hypothetical protein
MKACHPNLERVKRDPQWSLTLEPDTARHPSSRLAGRRLTFARLVALLPCLAFTTEVVAAAPACEHQEVRPSYCPVVPGLDYARLETTNWNNGEPWSVHIARLDRSRKEFCLASTLAHGHVFGTAPVSAIAEAFPKEQGEPLVVINAGFCIRVRDPYMGAPRGMVITDSELISSPGISGFNYSFWAGENDALHFGKLGSAFRATLPDGTLMPIGLNRECASDEVVLFTHKLGGNTRATNHLELVLENPKQKRLFWRVGETYTLRVKAINPAGNTALSNSIAVLTFGSQAVPGSGKFIVGDRIKLELKTMPEIKHVRTACHAIFPLVQNGEPLDKFDAQGPILRRNPRTAIGFNNRYFFMVVVDGRQRTLSMGMNARELAEFMSLLGCTEAMNLDGGGSSTFWLTGRTRNSVAGSRERDRGDALVIARRP